MRKAAFILAALLSYPMLSYAQLGNVTLKHFTGVPTGSCSRNQVAEDDANGAFYNCLSGSWNAVGGGSGITLQTNGTSNASQTALNFVTSTTNAVGLTATPSNPATSSEKLEITGAYSGSLASATGLPWSGLSGVTSANIIGLWTGTCSSSTYLNGAGDCTTPSGSGTVTDSTGTTTANQVAESTTTAHQIQYVASVGGGANPLTCTVTSATAGQSFVYDSTPKCVNAWPGLTQFPITTTPSTLAQAQDNTLVTLNNAGASVLNIPAASSMSAGFATAICNIAAGTWTLTPATSTLTVTGSGSTSTGQTTYALAAGYCGRLSADSTNTNYLLTITPANSTGLSGMTAGQVPIAATASTVTSSEALAGTGSGIATGPTSTTTGDCVKYADTAGTLADAGAACSGYATIQNSGTAQTQRSTINAVEGLKAVDDSTNSVTILRDLMPADGIFLREDFTKIQPTGMGTHIPANVTTWDTTQIAGTTCAASYANFPASLTDIGGWTIATGATAADDCELVTDRLIIPPPPTSPAAYELDQRVALSSVTTQATYYVGHIMAGAFSAATSSSIFFKVVNTTSAGTWNFCVGNAAGPVCNPTSPAKVADTNIHHLTALVNSSAVTFFYDGTQVGQVTTGIPTFGAQGGALVGYEVKNGTTTGNTLTAYSWVYAAKN